MQRTVLQKYIFRVSLLSPLRKCTVLQKKTLHIPFSLTTRAQVQLYCAGGKAIVQAVVLAVVLAVALTVALAVAGRRAGC